MGIVPSNVFEGACYHVGVNRSANFCVFGCPSVLLYFFSHSFSGDPSRVRLFCCWRPCELIFRAPVPPFSPPYNLALRGKPQNRQANKTNKKSEKENKTRTRELRGKSEHTSRAHSRTSVPLSRTSSSESAPSPRSLTFARATAKLSKSGKHQINS